VSKSPFVVVFDLDDTLYLERDFVRSGYKACDDWFVRQTGVKGLADCCQSMFEAGQRTQIFNHALLALLPNGHQNLVESLVSIYRNHRPTIRLQDDAIRFLSAARLTNRMALITDGPLQTQMNKVEALALQPYFPWIVFTDFWGKPYWKPHPRAFLAIQQWARAEPSSLVYVADNPAKDFVSPRRLGWLTIRIKRHDRVHLTEAPTCDHEPHLSIDSLDQLAAQLVGPQFLAGADSAR
jgi:putative hydrolase of the HAD superfamily